ncbi:hypothetical protein [Aureispira anguillae]|uniref:Outer membrane protein beta-barrel domain-containing protein n=1 Tax=Aureispira anguillae TaxID=2864201 RepID=A0A915YLR9_9BACT|nr:hypothetical protein [Aureispira anguillae]BDS15093.1 hypothetical protein AsAng_0058770 [Aureispira anguillae]
MKKYIGFIAFLLFFSTNIQAQHIGFGAKGGLLVGTQRSKRALLSYHSGLFFETMGKWQGENTLRRLGFVAQLGYHRRGASYNSGYFNNTAYSVNDLFHNISLSTLLKGNFKFNSILPYYAAGVRLDVTAANELVNNLDAQGVTPINFGFWLGGGIEWEPVKLPFGLFIEVNVSPDLTPQVFFPKGTQVQYIDPFTTKTAVRTFSEDYRVINLSIEVTFGVKFIVRKSTETATM